MQEQDGLTPGERELELAMKSLSPAMAGINPIAAAFAAGRRSSERSMRVWRAVAVLMLVVGAGSWLMPLTNDKAKISEPAIAIQPRGAEPPAAESLQALQQTIREKGLDGLPAENIPAVHVINAEDIF